MDDDIQLQGEKLKTLLFTILLSVSSLSNAYVTMDVDSELQSGTYMCKDAITCYMLVKSAEERGATQYCNSVTMKRDGRIIWYKNYWRNWYEN